MLKLDIDSKETREVHGRRTHHELLNENMPTLDQKKPWAINEWKL